MRICPRTVSLITALAVLPPAAARAQGPEGRHHPEGGPPPGAMFDILFELPDQEPGKKYVLTADVVRGQSRLFPRDDSAAA